jgi:hypothetical protein
MLDLLIIILFSGVLSRRAMMKGRPRTWGLLALLAYPGVFTSAVIGGMVGLRGVAVYVAWALGLAAGLLFGLIVVLALPDAPGWQPGMRWAGWCSACKANVWLSDNLTHCEHGHTLGRMKKFYVPRQQTGQREPLAPV